MTVCKLYIKGDSELFIPIGVSTPKSRKFLQQKLKEGYVKTPHLYSRGHDSKGNVVHIKL